MLVALLSVFLGLSLAGNFVLYFYLRKLKSQRPESYEVQELLHDLTSGAALVQIKRIAPANIFLRSTRDHG